MSAWYFGSKYKNGLLEHLAPPTQICDNLHNTWNTLFSLVLGFFFDSFHKFAVQLISCAWTWIMIMLSSWPPRQSILWRRSWFPRIAGSHDLNQTNVQYMFKVLREVELSPNSCIDQQLDFCHPWITSQTWPISTNQLSAGISHNQYWIYHHKTKDKYILAWALYCSRHLEKNWPLGALSGRSAWTLQLEYCSKIKYIF